MNISLVSVYFYTTRGSVTEILAVRCMNRLKIFSEDGSEQGNNNGDESSRKMCARLNEWMHWPHLQDQRFELSVRGQRRVAHADNWSLMDSFRCFTMRNVGYQGRSLLLEVEEQRFSCLIIISVTTH